MIQGDSMVANHFGSLFRIKLTGGYFEYHALLAGAYYSLDRPFAEVPNHIS
jgi:hypothetical protein